ncbi:MAG: hypothetical protein ACKVOU_00470 [Cytophagales bacterium]
MMDLQKTQSDKVHMTSMSELILELKQKGFSEEFSVTTKGELTYPEGDFFKPTQVKIVDFFRFEGESDPSDESILYALEAENGVKGVLSHIYGRELSVENQKASDFIKHVRALHDEHPLSISNP